MGVRVNDLTELLLDRVVEADGEGYWEALADYSPYLAERYLTDLAGLEKGEDAKEILSAVERDAYREHVLGVRDRIGQEAERLARELEERMGLGEREIYVVLMPGLFFSNAFQGAKQGVGMVGICLEQFGEDAPEPSLRVPLENLPIWLSHELAHLRRYLSLDHRTRSWFNELALSTGVLISKLRPLCPIKAFVMDEGMATWESLELTGREEPAVLGYSEEEYERAGEVYAKHLGEVVEAIESDEEEVFERLLFQTEPVSLGGVELPGRFGYFLGLRATQALIQSGMSPEELTLTYEEKLFDRFVQMACPAVTGASAS